MVGIGMGLPRNKGEVEGVVMKDDAVLVLGVSGSAVDFGKPPSKAPELHHNLDLACLGV